MIQLIINSLTRRYKKKSLLCFILISFIIFIFIEFSLNFLPYSVKNIGRCHNTVEEDLTLKYIVHTMHEVLNKLKIHHFLIYGSLWGAIRYSDPLPWDYDCDIGVLYDDIIEIDVERLFEEFHKRGIHIFYQNYAGNYKVVKGNITGDIMIFRDYYNDGILRRTGIESWLLFLHYRYYHQFPKYLVERPLPTKKFIGLDFNVPRGGIEIQKYFYPKNWWKDDIPPGCDL